MSYGVVPSRHLVLALTIRALRTRLLSLRSVVPSRHKRCMYINLFQDKTNPSLVTGLRCKLYTRNPFDYRRLCELVLGCRVFRGKNCVTRARGNIFQSFPKAWQRSVEYEPISGQDTRRVSTLPIAMIGKTLNRCLCAF